MDNDLAMCTCSPKSQTYPGLHQKQVGQWFEGGDSPSVLRSGEAPPAVLRPALDPTTQKGHGAVWVSPEEATKISE